MCIGTVPTLGMHQPRDVVTANEMFTKIEIAVALCIAKTNRE